MTANCDGDDDCQECDDDDRRGDAGAEQKQKKIQKL